MKANDYSLSMLPLEAVELLDDMKSILNFGKYQFPVVSTVPNWKGRAGEQVIYLSGSTGRFYVCTSDQSSSSWSIVASFTP